jgi:hypothetical protein
MTRGAELKPIVRAICVREVDSALVSRSYDRPISGLMTTTAGESAGLRR